MSLIIENRVNLDTHAYI